MRMKTKIVKHQVNQTHGTVLLSMVSFRKIYK
jgi:hypothetical protein